MKPYRGSLEIVVHRDRDLLQILRPVRVGETLQITLQPDRDGGIAATTILRLVATGHLEFTGGKEALRRLQAFVDRRFPEGHECLYTEVLVLSGVAHVVDNLFAVWSGIHRVRALQPVKSHLTMEERMCSA